MKVIKSIHVTIRILDSNDNESPREFVVKDEDKEKKKVNKS